MFEQALKDVPSVKAASVFYDRAVGAPYIEIKLNREAMARYGMSVSDVQEILQVAVGGMSLSNSVEGRERFPIRVRYARELRDNPDDLKRILIPSMNGVQIPLGEIADIEYQHCQVHHKESQVWDNFRPAEAFDEATGSGSDDCQEQETHDDQQQCKRPHGRDHSVWNEPVQDFFCGGGQIARRYGREPGSEDRSIDGFVVKQTPEKDGHTGHNDKERGCSQRLEGILFESVGCDEPTCQNQ